MALPPTQFLDQYVLGQNDPQQQKQLQQLEQAEQDAQAGLTTDTTELIASKKKSAAAASKGTAGGTSESAYLSQMEADSPELAQMKSTISTSFGSNAPTLYSPKSAANTAGGFTSTLGQNALTLNSQAGVSLFAIMVELTLLAVKSGYDQFMTNWQIGTQAMQSQMAMATASSQNILAAGQAQAESERQQAMQGLIQGCVSLGLAGASILVGGWMGTIEARSAQTEYDEGVNAANAAAKKSATNPVEEEATDEAEAAAAAREDSGAAAAADDVDDADDAATSASGATDPAAPTSTTAAKKATAEGAADTAAAGLAKSNQAANTTQKLWKDLPFYQKFMNPASAGFKSIQTIMNVSMFTNVLSQGINGIVTYAYQMRVAYYTQQSAQWNAANQITQGLGTQFGDLFQRSNSLSQQGLQSISTYLSMLNESGSTITSAVSSLFRA